MHKRKPGKSLVIAVLLTVFSTTCLQAPAYAAIMTTQQIAAAQSLQADRDALAQRLLRQDVAAELVSMGVSPDSVQARINQMTPVEIAGLNGQLDALPAGGSSVLATIALVLIILILLDVAGVTDIFPKI